MLTILIALAAQAVPVSSASTPPVSPDDKRVCKLEEDISSRIRIKRICLKQREWDAIAKDTQRDLEGSRNDRVIAPNR